MTTFNHCRHAGQEPGAWQLLTKCQHFGTFQNKLISMTSYKEFTASVQLICTRAVAWMKLRPPQFEIKNPNYQNIEDLYPWMVLLEGDFISCKLLCILLYESISDNNAMIVLFLAIYAWSIPENVATWVNILIHDGIRSQLSSRHSSDRNEARQQRSNEGQKMQENDIN